MQRKASALTLFPSKRFALLKSAQAPVTVGSALEQWIRMVSAIGVWTK